MKKILIGLSLLFIMSGCDSEEKSLSCTSSNESNGVTTTTTYDVKYKDDQVKYVTITYDYNQTTSSKKQDGENADTDGITEDNNTTNNNEQNSDNVVDGVVGDAIDTTIDGVTDTILDLAGIKNNMQNQMSMYDNIEGLTYNVDVDNDNEYKVTYKIDVDVINEDELSRFDIRKDFSDLKSNYENLGYTCE